MGFNPSALATVIPEPYWSTRIAQCETAEELLTQASSYLRASIAKGWPPTPAERDALRVRVAEFLIQAANSR